MIRASLTLRRWLLPPLLASVTGLATLLASPAAGAQAPPTQAREQLLAGACQAIAARVAAVPGQGPAMLGSYEPAPGQGPLAPALQQAAFVYDNALAGVALVACHRVGDARRIADAMVAASARDRHYHDGRLRNAYRAGALPAGPAPLPGWWDTPSQRWFEDAYQAGTATGNVAWAALMLLAVYDATHERRYLDSAGALMGWVDATLFDAAAPGGFIGGYFGEEPSPVRQTWKSTEHNVDAYAAFSWLARRSDDPRWPAAARRARGFVEAMWQPRDGRFVIGTRDDGRSLNSGPSALDAVLWPLIAIPEPPADWRRAWTGPASAMASRAATASTATPTASGRRAPARPRWCCVPATARRTPPRCGRCCYRSARLPACSTPRRSNASAPASR